MKCTNLKCQYKYIHKYINIVIFTVIYILLLNIYLSDCSAKIINNEVVNSTNNVIDHKTKDANHDLINNAIHKVANNVNKSNNAHKSHKENNIIENSKYTNYKEIKSVRIWGSPEGTRVVFDLEAKIEYKIKKLISPYRIIINFKNIKLNNKLAIDLKKNYCSNKKISSNVKNNIQNITTDFHANDLIFIIELKDAINLNNFMLNPNERYGYRLVLDLEYIEQEKQKILALFDLDHKSKFDIKSIPNKHNIIGNINNNSNSHFNLNSNIGVNKKFIIAIDPGHGGEDPGAIGSRGTLEKDIVLSIARILKDQINQRSNMQAFLIRSGDYYISLYERMLKARHNKADLFLSIHADAFADPRADGASVFILSEKGASSAAANWLADTQNRSDTIGGVRFKNKQDPLATVLLDLSQTANFSTSMQAAKNILFAMQNTIVVHKARVEKANFAVLKAPDVPSVLIETGFISNPQTEFKLRSFYYQKKIAYSIVKGIDNYFAFQAKNNYLNK